MIVVEPTQFVVVVSIATSNVGNPGSAIIGYVFEHGGNPDVAHFPSWPQGITRKSVE